MSAQPAACAVAALSPKQQCIVDAATRVFLEHGFHAASMQQIAAEAGVSKQTIYNNFGSKDALFAAIITQRCRVLLATLDHPPEAADCVPSALRHFARTLLDLMLEPQTLALHRLIIAEAGRFPRIGELYFEIGPARGHALLADYLRTLEKRGLLRVPDPELAAQQFTSALVGYIRTRALVLNRRIPARERKRIVDYTVDCFLNCHAPG